MTDGSGLWSFPYTRPKWGTRSSYTDFALLIATQYLGIKAERYNSIRLCSQIVHAIISKGVACNIDGA